MNSSMDAARSALLLVDFQQRLMPAIHGAEAAIAEAQFLGGVAAALEIPVLGTEQNPAGLGPNDPRIAALCGQTLPKLHFDGCADGLVEALQRAQPGLAQVVIAGCEAHVCLLQTALGLRRARLEVFVVPAACGSRMPNDHALAMQRLAQAGAQAVSAEMVAFEWLGSSANRRFKPVLDLIKARSALPALKAT